MAEAGSAIQRMQKALTEMNIQLGNVLTDLSGVSGMKIIGAILEGERDPWALEETKRLFFPIRFGIFEVDLQAGELRRQGYKIKLQEQPFQVLAMLLERPGEVVTRERSTAMRGAERPLCMSLLGHSVTSNSAARDLGSRCTSSAFLAAATADSASISIFQITQ